MQFRGAVVALINRSLWSISRLVKFDDVPVRISDKEERNTVWKLHCSGDCDFKRDKLASNGVNVIDLQRNMGESRMFLGRIHEDVGLRGVGRGVQDEIDINSARMLHHRDRFRPDGADYEFESNFFIKGSCRFQAANPQSDVINACNLFH